MEKSFVDCGNISSNTNYTEFNISLEDPENNTLNSILSYIDQQQNSTNNEDENEDKYMQYHDQKLLHLILDNKDFDGRSYIKLVVFEFGGKTIPISFYGPYFDYRMSGEQEYYSKDIINFYNNILSDKTNFRFPKTLLQSKNLESAFHCLFYTKTQLWLHRVDLSDQQKLLKLFQKLGFETLIQMIFANIEERFNNSELSNNSNIEIEFEFTQMSSIKCSFISKHMKAKSINDSNNISYSRSFIGQGNQTESISNSMISAADKSKSLLPINSNCQYGNMSFRDRENMKAGNTNTTLILNDSLENTKNKFELKKQTSTSIFSSDIFKENILKSTIEEFKNSLGTILKYGPYNKLGYNLFCQGNFGLAIEVYKKSFEINDKKIETYYHLTNILFSKLQKFDLALRCLNKILELEPNDDVAFYFKGVIYRSMNKTAQAIENFEKVKELESKEHKIEVLCYLGKLYFNISKFENAQENIEQALLLNQTKVKKGELYVILSDILYMKGDIEASIKNLQKLTSLLNNEKEKARAYLNLGKIYEKSIQTREKAKCCYYQAVSYDRNLSVGYLKLAMLLKKENKNNEAIENLNLSISKDKSNFKAYWNLGQILEEAKKNESAIEEYSNCLEINPGYIKGYLGITNVYVKQGKFDWAIGYYKRAINNGIKDDTIFFKLGYISENYYKKIEYAIENYKKAVTINPLNERALFKLGFAFASKIKNQNNSKCKKYFCNLALECFKQIILIDPENLDVYSKIASLYSESGKIKLAELFEKKHDKIFLINNTADISNKYTEESF